MEFKGSKTEQNLLAAFAGEAMARDRYDFYSYQAKKEGYQQIAEVFTKTAENEKEHAELIFKILKGIGDTKENLKNAAEGEHSEWADIYKESEKIAREEGFNEIADFFYKLASVEETHETKFLEQLTMLEAGAVFKESYQTKWICRNCGYVHTGKEAPKECPLCKHPEGYFQRKN